MRRFIRLTIAVLCVSIAAFTCFACGETEPEPKEKTVLDSPVIASAVYTGEKQTAAVPESDGYTVTTNDGGISAGNIADVRGAGAAGACVMSGAMTCPDIENYLGDLK